MSHLFLFVKKFVAVFVILCFAIQMYAQKNDTINTVDENGLKQGFWLKTDNYGRKVYEGNFADDLPVGTFRYYYDNGRLKAVSEIGSGGQNSFTTLYHPNGRKMSEGNYVNRQRDSVWLIYDTHGQLLTSETYSSGVLQGKKATVFSSAMDKEPVRILQNSGAVYEKDNVVEDGNIVTANGPAAAKEFAEKLAEKLEL